MILKQFTKRYKWLLIFMFLQLGLWAISPATGEHAFHLTLFNIFSMLKILPPIFILIGLLDAWVPRETMIKHMGKDSGVKGIAIALILGSFAAGPLYAAFPIAAILIKKGARLSYVLFFLGVWSTSKLPMVLFEITSFGIQFTLLHISINLVIFLFGSLLIERLIGEQGAEDILKTVSEMA